MATKGKDVGSAGKAKRGTSPSMPLQSGSSANRRSPKPSSNLDSTDKDHSTASVAASPRPKQTPSYLKPTISSLNVKREDSNLSASVNRRRSFDKPPSLSQIRKALLSPTRRRPARSSSLTPSKPSMAPKPVPVSDRTSKTPRVVRSQTTVAKSVGAKKATAAHPSAKKEADHVGTPPSAKEAKAPDVAEAGEKLNTESESERENHESLVHDVQEGEVKSTVDNVVEVPSHSSPHVDVASNIEPDGYQDEKVKPCEISTVPENQDASTAAGPEESYDQECKDESISSHPEEKLVDEPKVEEAQHKEGMDDAAENPISNEEKDSAENPISINEEEEKDGAENPISNNEEGEKDAAENPICNEEGEKDAAKNLVSKEEEMDAAENPISEEGKNDAAENPTNKEGENDGAESPINKEAKKDAAESPINKEGEKDAAENPINKEGETPFTEDKNKEEAPTTEDHGESQNKDKVEEQKGDEGNQKHDDRKVGEDVDKEREEVVVVVEEEKTKNAENMDKEREKIVVEEEKPKAENAVLSKQQSGKSKKDSQDQNGVIEETASKLLEKRKNKVRALVGAFETVMSLQDEA